MLVHSQQLYVCCARHRALERQVKDAHVTTADVLMWEVGMRTNRDSVGLHRCGGRGHVISTTTEETLDPLEDAGCGGRRGARKVIADVGEPSRG